MQALMTEHNNRQNHRYMYIQIMMLPKTIIKSATLKLQLPKTETVRHTFGLWDIKYEIAHYCKHIIFNMNNIWRNTIFQQISVDYI